ncbi:MAG: response regulator [Verrucomicrobia bacterium]|nr:response regulator [Verrucomicrobiota bacterium]
MSDKKAIKPIEILLVEDSAGDARLVQEMFREAKLHNSLTVVGDGIEAMACLRREGKYAAAREPDLVMLDLNLPRKDGREVLIEMRKDPVLKRIPVVVLTGSKAEEDILQAYDLNADAYLSKPIDLNQMIKLVRSVDSLWLAIIKRVSE